ncbi:MAG: hypothetical protein LBU65_04870 [Planctomycetaceae bacterium]|nr:hypothetical protein [Planctomycetaceae bacterium]
MSDATFSFDAIFGSLYDIELQVSDVKSQIQSLERDLSLTLSSLDKTKNAIINIAGAMEKTRTDAEKQFEAMANSQSAEDEMRKEVTSSFSEMFKAITTVFGTAKKLGIVESIDFSQSNPEAQDTVSPVEGERFSEETEAVAAAPSIPSAPAPESEKVNELKLPTALPTIPTELPDLSDIPELEELKNLTAKTKSEEPNEPEFALPTFDDLPAELSKIEELPESVEADGTSDEIDEEGNPDDVADLIQSMSTPLSAGLTEIPATETDKVTADLEKMLDQQ